VTKERRLGRGLEALLGRAPDEFNERPTGAIVAGETTGPATNSDQVSVYEIDRNPFQPRRDFDEAEIDSLADSIQQHGMIQPIVVRRAGERYQLVAGERRLRAAIKAGLPHVTVQIRDVDDRQANEMAIVENLQRYGCTQEELARRLRIDRSTLSNLIRLLELPADVQTALRSGAITPGHARALLPLGAEREQINFCQRIQQEGLSVRATEDLVQQAVQDADEPTLRLVTDESPASSKKRPRAKHLASLEQQFRAALGTKVDLRETSSGRGKIVIHFKSHEEFERLQDLLCDDGSGASAHAG
jgi:ParB family chromosome partitioning protein